MSKFISGLGGAQRLRPFTAPVAQVSNLLYRRFPIGGSSNHRSTSGSQAGSTATQQIGNLRYRSTGRPGKRVFVLNPTLPSSDIEAA
ncbi:MAG: hypothetical protein C5B50_03795 [Verrucomicrobia bacterium]|nr:MAG: hypothetical protein C5B50_03795 [Verrucomicrobiota bacterium]